VGPRLPRPPIDRATPRRREPIDAGIAPNDVEMILDNQSESELHRRVAAAARGDGEAFGDLVRPSLTTALSMATLITGSSADGADAVQDALMSAWKSLGALRDPVAFPAWFRTHVIRAAVRHSNSRRRLRLVDLETADQGTDGGFHDHAQQARLADALSKLDPRDRAVLGLRYVAGYSTAETAVAMSIPEGTVKSRLNKALGRLRAVYLMGEQ
jgi:RNA polymerase sigma factor (sigma-70 family)